MAAENHSPPARSLRRTQCTNLWVVYNLSLIHIVKPIGFHRESTALNDTDMKYLLLYLEETYGLTNEKKIAPSRNSFNAS